MDETPKPRAEDVPPPATLPVDDVAAAYENVRLELKVEELERRLKARAIELETEMRGKERLRERVTELTKRIDELQETASALHREAVSATALSRELDETLRVASETRRQLGDALDAERGRREAAEKAAADAVKCLDDARRRGDLSSGEETRLRAALESAVAERDRLTREAPEREALLKKKTEDAAKHEAEAKRARSEAAHARLKAEGHETHIDSLRAERDELKSDVEAAGRETALAREEVVRAKAEIEALRTAFEADLRRAREESRTAMDNAEQIRREGVEAFEKSRDLQARLEIDAAKHKREAERLKAELSERADREFEEMRRTLDAERARLYADLELERRAAESARRPAASEASPAFSAAEAARRDDIRREADAYLASEPVAQVPPDAAPVVKNPPPALVEPDPASHPQWDDEIRLLLWIAIGLGVVALVVSGTLIAQG